MGKRYQSLQEDHADFIRAQKLFFVGTAANDVVWKEILLGLPDAVIALII